MQNNLLHTPDSITQFTQKMDIFGFSIKVTISQDTINYYEFNKYNDRRQNNLCVVARLTDECAYIVSAC